MAYAVISGGIVINVVEADADFAAAHGLVALTQSAGIGWQYAGGVFTAPEAPPAEPPTLSVKQFRDLFTGDELAAIAASDIAGVRLLLLKLTTRSDVPMGHPDVIGGLAYLVSVGLLTEERKASILS